MRAPGSQGVDISRPLVIKQEDDDLVWSAMSSTASKFRNQRCGLCTVKGVVGRAYHSRLVSTCKVY